jgi:hypothetical protein
MQRGQTWIWHRDENNAVELTLNQTIVWRHPGGATLEITRARVVRHAEA